MSALRISRPGYPTQLIPVDDGITPRRISPYVRGGPLETQRPRQGGTNMVLPADPRGARPGGNVAAEPDPKPLCGVVMALSGVPCARRSGHRDNHSTPEAVEKNRLRRRRYYVAMYG